MSQQDPLSHINAQGHAKMVDVSNKPSSARQATAHATVEVNAETFARIQAGPLKKGDVLSVAQVSGIQAAKHTWELIPMCHPILLSGVDLTYEFEAKHHRIHLYATVSCQGLTGVEMEALTAVSVAALTIYDMCKAMQKDIVIKDIFLVEKTGGVHGDYRRLNAEHQENKA